MTDTTTTLPPGLIVALHNANGRRRERTLGLGSLADLIERVRTREDDGVYYDWTGGGAVPGCYDWPAWTTIALAVKVDGVTFAGVNVGPAKAATPGRVWSEVSPWGRGLRFPDKLRAWTKRPDVFRID